MKFGQLLPNYARWFRGKGIYNVLSKAKELNLDSLWLVDHVVVTGAQRVGYGNGYMDLWTATSYFAGVCETIDYHPWFSQCVIVIPYRPPIQQAKVIATVDSLTGGHLMIGAGSGYNPEEFKALGLPLDDRTGLIDDYLKCMIELWKNPVASYHGKYADFEQMTISVRPVQQPHPPILQGARGPRPFRRIGEYCQGYVPSVSAGRSRGRRIAGGGDMRGILPYDGEELTGPERLERDIQEIMKYWNQYGRKGKPYVAVAPFFCQVTDNKAEAGEMVERGTTAAGELAYVSHYPKVHVDDIVSLARQYNDAGADHFCIHPGSYRYKEWDNEGNLLHQMNLIAEHVLPKLPRDTNPVGPFSYVE